MAERFDLARTLRLTEQRGYKKFVLIPAGTDDTVRQETIEGIQKVLAKQGKTSEIYKMGQKTIPVDLSREFFELSSVPKEVIDFVVGNFPTYLRVLELFRADKDINSILNSWDSNWNRLGIPYEQASAVEERARAVLANKGMGLEPK